MSCITIVSGLPRSGTSLMMQMLAAAGVPIQTDALRTPDQNNPKGYYEWERIKQLPKEPNLISECEGKAVKVISTLLMSVPIGFEYRVIFMERNVEDVAASQEEMIDRLGTRKSSPPIETVQHALRLHRRQVDAWLKTRPDLEILRVDHSKLLTDTDTEVTRIAEFLELNDDAIVRMRAQVDPKLWRQRRTQEEAPSAS